MELVSLDAVIDIISHSTYDLEYEAESEELCEEIRGLPRTETKLVYVKGDTNNESICGN